MTDDPHPVAAMPGSRERRSDDDALEWRVRDALAAEASAIEPPDRLAEILAASRGAHEAHEVEPDRRRASRTAPLAAAAAAVLVATAAWLARIPAEGAGAGAAVPAGDPGRRPSPSVPVPVRESTHGADATSTSTTTRAEPATRTPAGDVGRGSGAEAPAMLPVYRVGVVDSSGSRLGLVREHVPDSATSAGQGVSAKRALRAARLSVESTAATFDAGYRALWDGSRVVAVDIGDVGIVVTLSTGVPSLSRAEATLAVQQLVWTVQDAAQVGGSTPVRFVLADGSTRLAGPLTTGTAYTRTTVSDGSGALLAPVWIDSPAPREVVPAGSSVVVSGEASTPEALLDWELTRAGALVASGHISASAAAPARGTYTVDIGPLPRGFYAIRVLDGSVLAQADRAAWQVPFEVR